MKPLMHSFAIRPMAAAVLLGGALLALSGCKDNDNDNAPAGAADTTAPASNATTAMPASTATTTMPADTTTPADSTGAMADTGGDMSGAAAMPPAPEGPVTDTEFYTEAMKGDQTEINSAQLVEKQGSSADVKALAKKIESDHAAFDKKVKAAAGSSVTAPTAADTTDSSLAGKTGAELDKAYVDAMVTDHQTDIPKFENAAANASTAKAKALASQALPTLRTHLKLAQDLQQKMAAQ